ncbi:unnamed protein product [Diamesa hyperborea]
MFNASRLALRRALPIIQQLQVIKPLLNRPNNIIQLNQITKQIHLSVCRWQQENKDPASVPLGKVEGKMQLMYTCKVCETRNSHIISKQAYTEGVVFVKCKQCENNHLIADNLKWFRDSKTNIEDLLAEKGETVRKISSNEASEYLESSTNKK